MQRVVRGRKMILPPDAQPRCEPPNDSRLLETLPSVPGGHPVLAKKNFNLLMADPFHPSLHFKRIDKLWSVRVGFDYRALGLDKGDTVQWFWIGHHNEYNRVV